MVQYEPFFYFYIVFVFFNIQSKSTNKFTYDKIIIKVVNKLYIPSGNRHHNKLEHAISLTTNKPVSKITIPLL